MNPKHRDPGRSVGLHLFQELSTLGHQFAHTLLFRQGLGGVLPMFPASMSRPLQLFAGARSGTRAAVHAASFICPSSGRVWLCPMKIDRPTTEIEQLLGFVSQKSLVPPAQIDVERRRHVLAFPQLP